MDLDSDYALSDEHVARFRRDGFIKLKNVLSSETLAYFGREITRLTSDLNTKRRPLEERSTYDRAFLQVMNLWDQSPLVGRFVMGQRLARIGAELLQVQGVRLYHDQSLYKEPGGGITPAHADQYYWPLASDRTITAWVPLQAVSPEMGPLGFYAGSQSVAFGRDLEISDESEEKISANMAAHGFAFESGGFDLGEVSFHLGWTFHKAGANVSDHPRSVMTIIYMDADMRLSETHTMIGNPAMPVIADALAKGMPGIDADAALQAMLATSTQPRPDAPVWAQRSWDTLDRHGYLPFDVQTGESVSMTAELDYGDAALAQVAQRLGRDDLATRFSQRAAAWKQLFDPTTRTLRGKDSNGRWRTPFDPTVATSPMNNPGDYTEANAYQYTATPALHDAEGFRDALGGAKGLEAWLDDFFTRALPDPDKHLGQEALIGQYAHGNEPSHHIAWLYAFTDAPGKGHDRVQEIVRRFYLDTPDGIVGNDDAGQMSAWLVFATLGVYPAQPARGEYVLGVPLVREATVRVGDARLRIRRVPREGATLDSRVLSRTAAPHAALAAGGTLRLGPKQ